MPTVLLILALTALLLAIASAANAKVPLYVSVILLAIVACLAHLPLR